MERADLARLDDLLATYGGGVAFGVDMNGDGASDLTPSGGAASAGTVVVETVAGKGWYPHFRFYSPLEPCLEYEWTPGDIVEVSH